MKFDFSIDDSENDLAINYIWFFRYLTEELKNLKFYMSTKNKELINNISQTISKELKKPNGGNKKLIDTLQKILDKAQ